MRRVIWRQFRETELFILNSQFEMNDVDSKNGEIEGVQGRANVD
jgi:hypothetical protein